MIGQCEQCETILLEDCMIFNVGTEMLCFDCYLKAKKKYAKYRYSCRECGKFYTCDTPDAKHVCVCGCPYFKVHFNLKRNGVSVHVV